MNQTKYAYGVIEMNNLASGLISLVVQDRAGATQGYTIDELISNTDVLYQLSPRDIHTVVYLATMRSYDKIYSQAEQEKVVADAKRRIKDETQ